MCEYWWLQEQRQNKLAMPDGVPTLHQMLSLSASSVVPTRLSSLSLSAYCPFVHHPLTATRLSLWSCNVEITPPKPWQIPWPCSLRAFNSSVASCWVVRWHPYKSTMPILSVTSLVRLNQLIITYKLNIYMNGLQNVYFSRLFFISVCLRGVSGDLMLIYNTSHFRFPAINNI